MKRLLMVAAVVAALAAVLALGIGATAAAGPGWGRMAGDALTGDHPMRMHDRMHTQDQLQIHQPNMDGMMAGMHGMHAAMGQAAQPWLPDGATIDSVTQDVQVDGTTKTVTMTFHLTLADGTTSEVQRVHVFTQQADGSWVLTSAPDCPYR